MAVRITIEPPLDASVRIGLLGCDLGRVEERDPALDAPLAAAEEKVRAGDVAGIDAARALYRAFGIDPTRTRPSSEALLRRVRRGEPLPRINTAVDVCNWCSVEVQLPYGLYDAGALEPPLTLRRGGPGDGYAGIRKEAVHLAGRLALFDGRGPFRQPDLGFGPDDDQRSHQGGAGRGVRAPHGFEGQDAADPRHDSRTPGRVR